MGNLCANLKRFTANINVRDACKSSCCNSVQVKEHKHHRSKHTPTPTNSPIKIDEIKVDIEIV